MSLLLSVQDNHLEVQGLASHLCADTCSNHWITFQTGGEYLQGGGRKGKGADEENILFPFVIGNNSWIFTFTELKESLSADNGRV